MLTRFLNARLDAQKTEVARALLWLGLRPWHVTAAPPTVAWLVIAPALVLGSVPIAVFATALVFPLDAVDGAMARLAGTPSVSGRVWDVMADRISDSGLLCGVILYSAHRGATPTLGLCVVAAAVWNLQSQATIAVQTVAARMSLGSVQRTERLVVLVTGLVLTGAHVAGALALSAGAIILGGVATLFHRLRNVRILERMETGASCPGDRDAQRAEEPTRVSTIDNNAPTFRPTPDATSAEVTKWLVEECRDTGNRVKDLLLSDEKLLATGFTLLSAASSVAIASGKAQLLMALPFALSVLFCCVEYQHCHVMALGGYKAILEEAIKTRIGVPVIAWETIIAPTQHRGRAVMAVRTLVVAFYLGSIYAAGYQAVSTATPRHWGHNHSTLYIVLTASSIVLGAVASLIALRAARHEFSRVAAVARAELLGPWVGEPGLHAGETVDGPLRRSDAGASLG